jgi:hypothetical protein
VAFLSIQLIESRSINSKNEKIHKTQLIVDTLVAYDYGALYPDYSIIPFPPPPIYDLPILIYDLPIPIYDYGNAGYDYAYGNDYAYGYDYGDDYGFY